MDVKMLSPLRDEIIFIKKITKICAYSHRLIFVDILTVPRIGCIILMTMDSWMSVPADGDADADGVFPLYYKE